MERDRAHPLSGWVEFDDIHPGGERCGGKRGRGTQGKIPFVAAVETNEVCTTYFLQRLSNLWWTQMEDQRTAVSLPLHTGDG